MTKKTSSRRKFLSVLGSAAAFSTSQQTFGQTPSRRSDTQNRPAKNSRRLNEAHTMRLKTARSVYFLKEQSLGNNQDEITHPSFVGNFSKSLPHNRYGIVNRPVYNKLKKALEKRNIHLLNSIRLGGTRKLANPQASYSFNTKGADSHSLNMPPAPSFGSAETAGEMVEVYWHAFIRDIPFNQYRSDPQISDVLQDINGLSHFKGPKEGGIVTENTLFRGETKGDLLGNYISQFLLLPIPFGATTIHQKYSVPFQDDDHGLKFNDWLAIQRGNVVSAQTLDPVQRYIGTGRDLGEYVHKDFPYQAYLNAAMILLGMKASTQLGNPYNTITNQGGFVTFGAADILTMIPEVSQNALRGAWYHKWLVHRRLRPETYAGYVHQHISGIKQFDLHDDVLNSSVLPKLHEKNNSYLLPLAYPEGSPTHPAYPAGHAAIAGACVTVLKAFFQPNVTLKDTVEVDYNTDATSLKPYSGTDQLTIGGELDKLASNISLGRDIAGVHWRTDGIEGMKLGEKIAITYLKDHLKTYKEKIGLIEFSGFDGTMIRL